MTANTTTSLKLSRIIAATPAEVFEAWTDPKKLSQWSAPEGVTVDLVEVDLAVGGKYHIRMKSPEAVEFNAVGVYRIIEPPHRLQYTWRWEEQEHDVGETVVTIEFVDIGGATEVRLTHDLFPNDEAKSGHADGWNSCFNRLEALFA